MAGRRTLDTTIRQLRIGVKDRDDKYSTQCWVSEFHNALNQVRGIAFDGMKWFVQGGDRRAAYTRVGEDEVPQLVRDRFAKHIEDSKK